MPRDDRARRPAMPAPVDEAVDLVHLEAPHLREPTLPPDHTGGVLLPVDDVGEGVLDRPRVASGWPRHPPLPVRRAQAPDQAVELGELAEGSLQDPAAGV